jgi:hypothetical protein
MAKTEITSEQIKNQNIKREDVNTTEEGQALITKVVAGTGIAIASTGADSGTGDVTVSYTGAAGNHHTTHESEGGDEIALGSIAGTLVATQFPSIATAGTFTKVTIDITGRVTLGAALSANDIPTLTASKISDFDTQVRTSRLDQLALPLANVSLNNYKITNLANPVDIKDASTREYVDTQNTQFELDAIAYAIALG